MRYFIWIILCTVLLTGVGVIAFGIEYRHERLHHVDIQRNRAFVLIDDVRDYLASVTPEECRKKAFTDLVRSVGRAEAKSFTGFAASPVGAFTWQPTAGLAWQTGLSASLRKHYDARRKWSHWATPPAKSAPQRALEEWVGAGEHAYILWGRVGVTLYALIFDVPPVRSGTSAWLWLMGLVFVVFLAFNLTLGVVLLQRDAAQARRDEARKTRFVSDVAHELKTPLAAIGLWIDLLAAGRLTTPEKQHHAHAVIADEKNRLVRLVDSLLDFARLELGHRRYTWTSVDVGDVVRGVADVFAHEFTAQGLVLDIAEGVCVEADTDAVREIVTNLLSNAAKYAAAEGPVAVCVQYATACVTVAVSDCGPGLSPESARKVFERFYRDSDTEIQAKGGFGLGLPIARGLARGMGGDLAFAPRTGGGSIFTLTLPLRQTGRA